MIGVLALAAAVSVGKFDLSCHGTQRSLNLALLKDETKTSASLIHIDLDSKMFCTGACTYGPAAIPEVTDSLIRLLPMQSEADKAVEEQTEYVSRVTGEHRYFSQTRKYGGSTFVVTEQCEKLPFSPFPVTARKF